jgi:hypothetical protein
MATLPHLYATDKSATLERAGIEPAITSCQDSDFGPPTAPALLSSRAEVEPATPQWNVSLGRERGADTDGERCRVDVAAADDHTNARTPSVNSSV